MAIKLREAASPAACRCCARDLFGMHSCAIKLLEALREAEGVPKIGWVTLIGRRFN